MNFTPEQLARAKAAKSAGELLTLAKENGIVLTEEGAKKYYAGLHKNDEVSDEELSNVSGGCGYPYRRGDWTTCELDYPDNGQHLFQCWTCKRFIPDDENDPEGDGVCTKE